MNNTQPTDSSAPASPTSAPGRQVDDDPLAHLHKMSRTAGMGSQEYVAVNGLAVTTLILGLLSSLALILGTLLLFIPVVALIVGFLAIRQVRDSAGTQTGKGLATLGMVIALLFVAMVGGKSYLHSRQIAAEKDQIVELIHSFGENVKAGNFDAAYGQLSTKMKEEVKQSDLKTFWTLYKTNAGEVKDMRWNGYLDVQVEPETGVEMARGVILLELEDNKGTERKPAVFSKADGTWKFESMSINYAQVGLLREQGAE